MFVYRSNNLDVLVDCLSAVVQKPTPHVLSTEVILIQSQGMERYLSRELSRRCGIWAGCQFPFPRGFIRKILQSVLGSDERSQLYERELMSWILFDELVAIKDEPGFELIARHLKDDHDGSRRLLLAERLAYLFDQYITYRPELILSWDSSEPEELQGRLWSRLRRRVGAPHLAESCKRFVSKLTDDEIRLALPHRLSLLGGPGLPPLYLQIFARIGRVIPVHVFSLTACKHYFYDATKARDDEPLLPGESWHPLLASMGQVGGDYQFLLENLGGYQEALHQFSVHRVQTPPAHPVRGRKRAPVGQLSLFSDSASNEPDAGAGQADAARAEPRLTLLQLLQNSLVEGQLVPDKNAEVDDSITIDNCHSPLREIETLHDRLLTWFSADPTLRPEDVAVFAPDIEKYSSLIDAVFSARSGERPHIPYRIFDRSFRHEDPAARALLLGFKLLQSRFKVGDVLDLLQLDPVRVRYEISITELERLTTWFQGSNLRCNVDAQHRALFGLPVGDENTWEFGLRRLLLGFMIADDGAQIFEGIVPYDDVAAADGPLLGRLCELCDGLFALRAQLVAAGAEGLELSGWSTFLIQLAECLIGESREGAWDLGTLRQSLYDLAERTSIVTRDVEPRPTNLRLGHAGLIHLLEEHFKSVGYSADFLSGGVTFCALLPLRHVPFRRVCVLGLNQGEFPRSENVDPLNLILQKPRPGDRSLRADDRYLFLELLLSARQGLSLSYVGRSIQDNTPIPPSVLLTELKAAANELTSGREIAERVHPLQPFHPSYFLEQTSPQSATPRSFDQANFAGARALLMKKQPRRQLLATPLVSRAPDDEVLLSDLVRFFKDPALSFLKYCGINPQLAGNSLQEREPVELDPLSRYLVGESLLRKYQSRGSIEDEIEFRRGILPTGCVGRAALDELSLTSQLIAERAEQLRGESSFRVEHVQLQLQRELCNRVEHAFERAPHFSLGVAEYRKYIGKNVLLSGTVPGVFGKIRLVEGFGKRTDKRMLGLWIEHLALCAKLGDFEGSLLICRADTGVEVVVHGYRPVDAKLARGLLSELLTLQFLGNVFPLPFFPDPSFSFARRVEKALMKASGDDTGDAYAAGLGQARRDWKSIPLWVKQLYGDLDPLIPGQPEDCALEEQPFCRLAIHMSEVMKRYMVEDKDISYEARAPEAQS